MTFHFIFKRKNKTASRNLSGIQRTIRRLLVKIRIKKAATQVDMYQEALRFDKPSGCVVKETATTTVPMMDGEYDPCAAPGGHSTIVHRPNQLSRPSCITGDNAQDSFTPSPPFGPIENLTGISEVSSYRGSSMPVDFVSTNPTSLFSSDRDSRLSGLAPPAVQQRGTCLRLEGTQNCSSDLNSVPHINTRMAQPSLGNSNR